MQRIEVKLWLLFFFCSGKKKYSYLRFLLDMSK
nr:MAG TPA: hypothetical protein [Caudoviricetes sp.]